MADKEYKIKIKTEIDDKGIHDLKSELQNIENTNVKFQANSSEIEQVEQELEKATKEVERLENALDKAHLDGDDIEADIIADELADATAKAEQLQGKLDSMKVNITVDGEEQIDAVDEKIENVDDTIDTEVNVEGEEQIDGVNEKIENTDNKPINVPVNVDGEEQIDAVSDRIDGISNKLAGLVGGIGMVDQATKMWEASTSRQFQSFYLGANLADGSAKQVQQDIQEIVASRPGDDTFMNQLLVTATAQHTELAKSRDELDKIAKVSADYMAGSKMMGKMNLEAQQDIYKYLLDGNTAELERGSIVSAYVDDLKNVPTIQERALKMEEALNKAHMTGISEYDTASNNMEEFLGNVEKSRADLGDLFLPLEQGALKSALAINNQTGGALTGLIVTGEMIVPTMITSLSAIGEVAKGIEGLSKGWEKLKDKIRTVRDKMGTLTGKWSSVKAKLLSGIDSLKLSFQSLKIKVVETATTIKTTFLSAITKVSNFMKTSLIPALKSAGLKMLELGKNALISGYNALKSGAMWLVHKIRVLASAVANGIATASQWALNIAMSMNPIMLVVIAIGLLIGVLAYLYFNNEQVRGAIDGLGQSLYNIGTIIYGYLVQAWNFIITTLQNVWNYIVTLGGLLPANVSITGNQIIDTIVRVMAFIMTLPIQIGIIFINIIAKAMGFGNNFAQRMIQGATNTVNGFINKIRELPGMIQSEFARIESIVSNFVTSLPQRVWDLGASIVSALKSALGIGSPGFMYYMFEGELNRLKNAPILLNSDITQNVRKLGQDITSEFKPNLELQNANIIGSIGNNPSRNTTSQVNNFYFNDTVIDNEERMEKICDYITKKLTWNNHTAGRTV